MPADVRGIDPDLVASVLAEGLRCGGEWVEVFVEGRDSETVRLDAGAVAELRTDRDVGAGVRVLRGGRTGFAFTNVLTLPALLEAARAAAEGSGASQRTTVRAVDLRERTTASVQRALRPPSGTSAADKVAVLRRIDDAARSRGTAVRRVDAVHVDVTQDVLIANTDGVLVRDQRVRTRVTCRVTARRDGRVETGFDGPGAGEGMECYDDGAAERVGHDAADRALRALTAVEPPVGVLPVVLGPAGGGLLLHEACGHGLEGDGVARGSSAFAGRAGTRIASSAVTAVDEPARQLGYGSYGVDDEGTAAGRTVLVDAGVQVGTLTDLDSAQDLGHRSANGRRESYAHPPLARMSNTSIAPGDDPADAIVRDVRRGVYVVRLKGGDVDITSGDFAFSASESYLVEDGELTRPVAGLVLLGNSLTALRSVDAVGDDQGFVQALCGKQEQWVPVSYGGPTLRLTGLTVSGGDRG